MASRLSRVLLNAGKGRLYSAQAAAKPTQAASSEPVQVLNAEGGLTIATVESNSPVARVAVVVNAGPRFESWDELGVTHCLRQAAGMSNRSMSDIAITRTMQQTGGDLSCTSTREDLIYSTVCTRDKLDTCLDTIRGIISEPALKKHEFPALTQRMTVDMALLQSQPNVRVLELLHEAAYKETLGRSVYAPDFKLGTYTTEQLKAYMKKYFTKKRMTILGIGVDQGLLIDQADQFDLSAPSDVKPLKATYVGGERFFGTKDDLAYVAIATEGPSLSSQDRLAYGVLQMIMGAGSFVKYSENGGQSRLTTALSKAAVGPFAVSGLNVNYTDSGLFGFAVVGQPGDMETVLKTAYKEFVGVSSLTDEEVSRGKNQLKASLSMMKESGDCQLQFLTETISHKSQVSADKIDSVTAADVLKVAKTMAKGRFSMAAVGDLRSVPFLDQIAK